MGLIEKPEFEPRIKRAKARLASLEEQMKHLADEASMKTQLQLVIGKLETFAARVQAGLEHTDWSTRRELVRALVKCVEIDQEQVNVVFCPEPQGSFARDCHTSR